MKENNIIKLNESQLKQMIAESVKRVIKEAIEIANNVPEQYKKAYLKKMVAEHPDLDPDGFFWIGNNLKHSGKKRTRYTPKEVISKPEGMSDEEYEKTLVIPNNPKYREKLEMYDDEEFRPVVNGGRYFGGNADYGCDYEVSNKGRLKVLNHGNVLKSNIYEPYPAPTRNAMQFHLNGFDEEGNAQKTCPSVSYMVANAFLGEHDPRAFIVRHKDGDWRNNNVENLEWIPRKDKKM